MKVSFYRNLTWLIGILVAIEILLKVGYRNGLFMLIADLAVVLILTFLFHRMRVGGYDETAERIVANQSTDNDKAESEWQKKHDEWWRAHRQLKGDATAPRSRASRNNQHAAPKPSTPGSAVNLSQLERSNRYLKGQINYLDRKISLLRNDRNKKLYRNTDWYRQIVRMKKQIAKLKSEYR